MTNQSIGDNVTRVPQDRVASGPTLSGKRVLIIVENLPLPFDRRVWQEARTLCENGAIVSIICPKGKGYERGYEYLEGIHIHRHALPLEAQSAFGYLKEYGAAFIAETFLAWKIFFVRGVDIIHACNPPDLIFLVAAPFKLLGVPFIFDHHDINPELYEAKFGRRGVFWRLLLFLERLTFFLADVSLATNQSYRKIAFTRGRMDSSDVFVVRSGPDLGRLTQPPSDEKWKKGRRFLVGYVGVMGDQEGIDLLLEAVRHLVHDLGRRDIQFALVGSGPSLRALEIRSVELGVADFVSFLGRLSDADLFSVLATSDVCVNPDRVNPMNDLSTMNKILEYMALGKPIVQFDVKEGRFSAGDASLYARANDPVHFAEKILSFLSDEAARLEAGDFGRRRLQDELAWRHQAPILLRAYERALSKRRRFQILRSAND
ncbi:glycosyltransferase family 4 protein [Methylocystis parvus]|uniref:Glycosyltransferase family 4 protein n=1 Tax=Methylocystis parvus TaxID=134 RepID=A0A6B8M8X0_9HYPH|nr:glycosyltransferase family 4 protein [Methylocystis parvus]QGM99231.1 glycosyltransferase family 4 protein [Methylocystis parvus]WBK00388.1 glycosyltransferase family 4 protein [Methylocystis parvus OBBP]